ncbi:MULTISPECIES: RagB/SusD family nutrient uptake outer membrane protein [Butyricimonas]|uniref:RagB/SusD family nutrient uptake outer membrane protein n=1 Tax=Butyricimonas TaxID=574697 RepID=UPI001D08EFA1|nr:MULTISPECIES: RagB/SusD family nutrient uptake outer membrane protein [Butyricimonas]MCB6972878.1 RagB/SusD family nutrient uptake outer membrane protein [Butyricimonas synergistica]MCG4518414.1 RagB/SusD family nutrient uptake outer membrane protein [Butyricimonas sp. DFI.6.44]
MKLRYLLYSFIGFLGLASCDLTGDIDNIKPYYQLDESSLIRDAKSADLALRGVYELWRSSDISMITPNMGLLAGSLTASSLTDRAVFSDNTVKPESETIAKYYKGLYAIVNYASLVGEQLEEGRAVGLDSVSTSRMIGECRFLRGMANFFLLRAYGQFYDENSTLGIILVKRHMTENKAAVRSSVEDSYKYIMEDVEDAIKMIPEEPTEHYYISNLTARAFKSKVLLYQKKYKEAADLAKEVLDEAAGYGYTMETNFADIFKHGHTSSEALFAAYAWGFKERLITNIRSTKPGSYPQQVADVLVGGVKDGDLVTGAGFDLRFAVTFATSTYGPNLNGKYPLNESDLNGQSNSYFYLRLAEVYLIHAEAAIRGYDDYAGARASLKEITDRAGYDTDYVNTIPDNQLLEMVRQHKMLELIAEVYEEWFDLVRYHIEGDLKISDVKPTVVSDKQLIFPMPQTALAGNNLLEQNPL